MALGGARNSRSPVTSHRRRAKIGFVQDSPIPTARAGNDLAAIPPGRSCYSPGCQRADALVAGLTAVAPEAAFEPSLSAAAAWLKQRPQVMRAFKWQAAARKLGLTRAAIDERDRELFAVAWCHDDHWAAARGFLDRESRK